MLTQGACARRLLRVSDTNTRNKKLRELVLPGYNETALVQLLLNTSQLEYKLRNMFQLLLKQKRTSWDNYKKEASERMEELCTCRPSRRSKLAPLSLTRPCRRALCRPLPAVQPSSSRAPRRSRA